MKKISFFLLMTLLSLALKAGDVEFYLDVCRFQDTENAPYIESYLTVDGTSVSYKSTDDGKYQASINFLIKLMKFEGSDTLITFHDNYNLLSIPLDDTSAASIRQGFVDMKRIPVEPGKYLLQVIAKDAYEVDPLATVNTHEFEISSVEAEKFSFSDVQFVSSLKKASRETVFLKNGYEIIPFGMNAVYIDQDKLMFYIEYYHADKVFSSNYYAQATLFQGDQPLLMYDITLPKAPRSIEVFNGEFDISKADSRAYFLQIKLFNKELPQGKILRKKFHVYNSRVAPNLNTYISETQSSDIFSEYAEEQLDYYIGTLKHYSTEPEVRFSKALQEYDDKKNYLYSFWEKRSSPEKTIEALWKGHLSALNYVNESFESGLREGWDTDRGRVFLQYGIPNDIERYPYEGNRMPHEIWKYDRLGSQSQILFVFMDSDLASNEYPLIHSSKYGEIQNYSWQEMLVTGDTPGGTYNTRDNYEENRSIDHTGFKPGGN